MNEYLRSLFDMIPAGPILSKFEANGATMDRLKAGLFKHSTPDAIRQTFEIPLMGIPLVVKNEYPDGLIVALDQHGEIMKVWVWK